MVDLLERQELQSVAAKAVMAGLVKLPVAVAAVTAQLLAQVDVCIIQTDTVVVAVSVVLAEQHLLVAAELAAAVVAVQPITQTPIL